MPQTSRLLITGGSGFIGAEVVSIALSRGCEILNLDIRPPRLREHHQFWSEVDIRSERSVEKSFSEFRPSQIVHLASDVDVNLPNIGKYQTTVCGTGNVIRASERLPDVRRFIHVSTQYVVKPGIVPASETDFRPYTVYGAAKAETERLVRASRLSSWVIVRPTIIWGPCHPSFAGQIWRHMAKGTYLHPDVNGPLMRGYGYVENTAGQIMALLAADEQLLDRRVYYLGDGTLDYHWWADAFCIGLTGRPARRVKPALLLGLAICGSAIKAVGLHAPYDLGRYFRMTTPAPADFEPILTLAGPPAISAEQGVARSIEWLREIDPALFGQRAAQ